MMGTKFSIPPVLEKVGNTVCKLLADGNADRGLNVNLVFVMISDGYEAQYHFSINVYGRIISEQKNVNYDGIKAAYTSLVRAGRDAGHAMDIVAKDLTRLMLKEVVYPFYEKLFGSSD